MRAGKLIVPTCIVLGVLNSFTLSGDLSLGDVSHQSILAWIGQLITPVFGPLGIQSDNWPATVGLLTGILAKEVVIGSLNSLYMQASSLADHSSVVFNLWHSLGAALMTIPENIQLLGRAILNPVLSSAPMSQLEPTIIGKMYQSFGGQLAAMSYLLFVLLYVPCVSTIATIAKELNNRWALFSLAWSTGLAYVISVLFYQSFTFKLHPGMSGMWIGICLSVIFGVVFLLRRRAGSFEVENSSVVCEVVV